LRAVDQRDQLALSIGAKVERKLVIKRLAQVMHFRSPVDRLHAFFRTKSDQHADDDDANFPDEARQPCTGFGR